MPNPLTPRQWAERAFDGVEADESLFASVERVIGEAMAQAAAERIKQIEAEVAKLQKNVTDSQDNSNALSDHLRIAKDRIEQLEAAMRSIVERCGNSGRGNEFVNDRIIERVEEIAVEALGEAARPSNDAG